MARLGVIGNGHLIKLGRIDEETDWSQSFERVFDRADIAFPNLIQKLEGLERRPAPAIDSVLNARYLAMGMKPQTSALGRLRG